MAKEEEIDNNEFMIEMMSAHHEEMVAAVRSIKIPEPKDNSEAISKLDGVLKLLTDKLDKIQPQKITVEKTEINQKEVVTLLKELILEVKALNKKEMKESVIKDEKKEYVFTIQRDNYGYIQSVKVKQ